MALGSNRDYKTWDRFIKARIKYFKDLMAKGHSEQDAYKIVSPLSMKDLKKKRILIGEYKNARNRN